MNNNAGPGIGTLLTVIAICAAVGFGAVYASRSPSERQGPTASNAAREANVPTTSGNSRSQSISFTPSARLENLTKPSSLATPPKPKNPGTTKTQSPTEQIRQKTTLTGPNGERLNTGAMTTFVFKPTPMQLPASKFNDPNGNPLELANWKGRVVLLNLWATWCAPCRKEMPDLNKLQQELGSTDFEVVAVSIDRGNSDKLRQFLDEVGATSLRLYHDPTAQLGFTLKTIGMPATLLIDRQGREIGRLVGQAHWASPEAVALVKAAISAK